MASSCLLRILSDLPAYRSVDGQLSHTDRLHSPRAFSAAPVFSTKRTPAQTRDAFDGEEAEGRARCPINLHRLIAATHSGFAKRGLLFPFAAAQWRFNLKTRMCRSRSWFGSVVAVGILACRRAGLPSPAERTSRTPKRRESFQASRAFHACSGRQGCPPSTSGRDA
jgi:hypothetical protein